jgi:uncharacterized protein YjeT (DUF2065 family)
MVNDNNIIQEENVYCKRHPTEKTSISCAACGDPICPLCLVSTPVGMKCPNCAKSANSALTSISTGKLILAGIFAIFAGFVASIIGSIGFFVLLIGIPFGYFVGNTIMRIVGMKYGWKLEVITVAGIIIGAFGNKTGIEHVPFTTVIMDPIFMIAVVITIAAAIVRIRYI